jgi:hypothetical protein
MNRTRTAAVVTAVVLGLVTSAGLVLTYFANLHALVAAKSVLEEVSKLHVGKSTETDVQLLVNENGGENGGEITGVCGPNGRSHSFAVKSVALDWLGSKSAALRPFGNRVWTVNVFLVTDDGRLCYASYEVRALIDRYDLIAASASMEKDFDNPDSTPYSVDFGSMKGTQYVRSKVTAKATDDQIQRAFKIDLNCLTRVGGCRSDCEVMPLVWIDYQKEAQEKGWDIPIDETSALDCQKH